MKLETFWLRGAGGVEDSEPLPTSLTSLSEGLWGSLRIACENNCSTPNPFFTHPPHTPTNAIWMCVRTYEGDKHKPHIMTFPQMWKTG